MEKKSLAHNTVYSAISSASNIFLIVLVIAAARVLGDKAFGEFSFALATASIFEMFTDLGLNTLAARNVPRDRRLAGVYLPNVLAWKLILSAVAIALLIVTVEIMHPGSDARTAVYIMGGAVLIRSYKTTSFGFFQAFERFDLILLTTYIERTSLLVFGMIALLMTRNLIVFATVFALIRVPDILITYRLIHKHITPVRLHLDWSVIRDMQKAAVPFALSSIVLVAYLNIGTVILAAMRPSSEVGWYNAGYKIYEGLTTFPFLISTVLLPRLSSLFATDAAAYAALCRRALQYLFLSAVPLVVIVSIHASQVVRLVYGSEYTPGISALQVLLFAAILMFANWVFNTILISADLERLSLRIWSVGLAVMAVSNFAMIRWLGMIGAAYAVVVSETVVFILMVATSYSRLFRVPAGEVLLRPVAAGGTAFGVLSVLHPVVPAVSSLLFAVIYLTALIALGALRSDEWSAMRRAFLSNR